MKYLQPIFDQIPPELRALPRWVCWKEDKAPYCSSAINSKADVSDPMTWGSFEQARTAYEEGGFMGVGFVLNADGIVGVDLDHCVIDGKPSYAALKIMDDLGCQYIELSPSGTGLHGFGYAHEIPDKGRNGTINGSRVELYPRGRYLTMTGHTVKAGPLVDLGGYNHVYHQVRSRSSPTEEAEESEEIECNTSISSVGTIRLPVDLMPTAPGQRNRKVFLLARHLKLLAPNASMTDVKPIVQEWYRRALPFIGTKEWDVTWIDFIHSWGSVKYGSETLKRVLSDLPPLPPHCPAAEFGVRAEKLYRLCIGLQQHQGDRPFLLSCRIAGNCFGIDPSDAAKFLRLFCNRGLLEQVFKGVNGRASRYRVLDFARR